MAFAALAQENQASSGKEVEFTKLWRMQGLGASTSPAAVSSTAFYAMSPAGSTPGASVLPSARKQANSSIGQAMAIFNSSFKSDPTRQ
eukprot:CAMPEP_0202817210 /NCGR_PEP_ID=MMETSP1389-20130828/7492_1 /ASSEMBLY_ACC=CAM_ASM_000865 /TAXON_ID=302021 /ORGANISM="Rhodomonas sp., Strain CCMP768" /LENGTH=87 /DNA_ID=CAMNT_0049489389 /DNA_START=14 /DNA_END=277 /DNA_ORIENTATION=-